MSRTPSTMVPLGTPAPDFALPDLAGNLVRRSDFAEAPALLVMFICNHCPYVVHVRSALVDLVRGYQREGVAVVAIQPNDVVRYPDDRPERMRAVAEEEGFTFPYLYDETQEVARAYRAACTPDFFLYDAAGRLAYRGQLDRARPGNGEPVTGDDLTRAVDAVLAGHPVAGEQWPSLGCNIKWKPGSEPDYFG
ncbi:MAG: thioredoxin family protein [Deltaproteobacteria bacterium HGW-Deltaproteobacteria-14]|jgi:peroxiredoxin|nr:MAG: thioredoxin family protein [Deltaproteobacteria bacterium HGW-Deltaproteobacteria-14]